MDRTKPTQKQIRRLESLAKMSDDIGFKNYDGYVMLATGHALVSIAVGDEIHHWVVDRDGSLKGKAVARSILGTCLRSLQTS